MRLALQFSPSWIVKEAPDGQQVAVLPATTQGHSMPRAIVTFGLIVVKPDEPLEWQKHVAASDVPAGARIRIGRTLDHTTTTGWPLRLVEATMLRGDRDEVIEVRLCAFFTFLEHAAVAIARAPDMASLDAVGSELLAILSGGRPDWSGATTWVSALWEVPDASTRATSRMRTPEQLAMTLHEVDAKLATTPTATLHVARGQILLELKRPDDAVVAFAAACMLDESLEIAHYLTGVAYGEQDRHSDAIAAWQRANALKPRADTTYNIGLAQFFLKEFEPALESFRAARQLDPGDFMTMRKEIQCLYALGRFEAGQASQVTFRERWQVTADPRARFIDEYVFDQFDGDGFVVHATEILRRPSSSTYTLLVFQPIAVHDHHEHPLPATVTVETSDEAQAAGTPFVICLRAGERYQVIGASATLPPYEETRREVIRVLVSALQAAAH